MTSEKKYTFTLTLAETHCIMLALRGFADKLRDNASHCAIYLDEKEAADKLKKEAVLFNKLENIIHDTLWEALGLPLKK